MNFNLNSPGSLPEYYRDFIPVFITVSIFFLIARGIEVFAVTQRHILPDEASWIAASFFWDIIFACFFSLLLLLIYSVFRWVNRALPLALTALLLTLYFWISAGLTGYYLETLLPLGADFYAYSLSEIRDTIQTSVAIWFWHLLLMLSVPFLAGLSFWSFQKILWPAPLIYISLAFLFAGAAAFTFAYPRAYQFNSELHHSLTAIKTAIFLQESMGYRRSGGEVGEYAGDQEYPLLRPDDDPDVIGDFLETAEHLPHIVLIKIEGLGGSFMNPHAPYGGFTPFLDSLAQESLYWSHFLATSARSFNAHPSMLAALPGIHPDHQGPGSCSSQCVQHDRCYNHQNLNFTPNSPVVIK